MGTRKLVDVRTPSASEATRLPEDTQTARGRTVPENKTLYLAKNYVELNFKKIKRAISSLIYGKEYSRNMYAKKILDIKQKIENVKYSSNTSKNNNVSTANMRDEYYKNETQRRDLHQDEQGQANRRNDPIRIADSHQQTFDVPPQTLIIQQTIGTQQVPVMPQTQYLQQPQHVQHPQYIQQPTATQQMQYVQQPAPNLHPGMMAPFVVPPYVNASALPPEIYFQNNWYPPMPASVPSPQANMARTRPAPAEGRRLPNTRPMKTSARPVRQRYRMGNAPDRTAFYIELSKEVKKQLAPLLRMTTTQKLHVLSHIMYSSKIPNYPDEKMKAAAFELINKIEQLRLDYVPNANDGSSNIYKVIFNNLLRNDIVETLPEEIREKFESADEQYQNPSDFDSLIKTYEKLISDATNKTSDTASIQRRPAQPGELSSEWMAKMNQSLSPFREETENWTDLEKYQAMLYLLRGSQEDISDNIKVQKWVNNIDLIRQSDIHDANDYSKRNEQKIFFNNNLRTVLKNNLPENFQRKFDAINENFQKMDPSSQENAYENYLEDIRAIVREEINKLSKN